jgi:hypothetical protein
MKRFSIGQEVKEKEAIKDHAYSDGTVVAVFLTSDRKIRYVVEFLCWNESHPDVYKVFKRSQLEKQEKT